MRAALALFMLFAACATPRLERHEFVERHMGAFVRIVLHANDEAHARSAARAGFDAVARVDRALSDYSEDGPVESLARTTSSTITGLDPELLHALERAAPITRESDGAFDVTIGPVVRMWRKARREGVLPTREEVEAARALVDGRALTIDRDTGTLHGWRAGMRLDFGGIGQGIGADRALEALREHGIERALVDVSGDIALGAPPPGARGWVVEVEGGGKLLLAHCGVTTSGDTEQFFELGGQRFSHILDPRTGWPLASSNSVTVIARDATDADALATAVRVLGVEQGRAWIEARGARLLAPSSKPVPASDPHASEASSPEVDAGSSAARALQAQRANASSACVERACADH